MDSNGSTLSSEHHCVPVDGPQSSDNYSHFGDLPHYFQANPLPSNGGPSITVNHHREAGIHILHRAVALEALHNAAESFPQPKCHPETRTELLNTLYNWVIDPNPHHPIHWLHSPAGTGKSAVMQTICQRLQEDGLLGGSFFFKRGHNTCGNAKVLFATLAYQLALRRPEYKGPISRSVETDLSVLGRGMDVQLHNLILEPCKLARGVSPLPLLIDGLDECDGHNIQREILRLIGSTANQHHLALRILVASRPEPHIRETFEKGFILGHFDSTNIEQSFEDVHTYLHDEFCRIYQDHLTVMQHIPTPWPAPEILKKLVKNSSGYFVYAATVIKFVDDEYSWPSKQLEIVVQNLIPCDSESPFATLDQLYMQILQGVPTRHWGILSKILSAVVQFPSQFSLGDMNELLGLEPGTVELIIRPLHSVLNMSAVLSEDSLGVHHASFLDFLKDETRSSGFYVGSTAHKAKLGQLILKALAYTYDDPRKNLADLGLHSLYWYVEVHSHSEFILIL
ncbi:hypothetical protein B0H14DRAFT_2344574 [Mycena olivaceomarginata]|nr:hypothetical protein B0H14DRAFT_2344574 [Mycena olivaceomarginata]